MQADPLASCRASPYEEPMPALRASPWRRHVALPQDHGSWVFLLCPLVIGLAAAPAVRLASLALVVAALAGFLARQPITIAIRALSGRRRGDDLAPAAWWLALYGAVGLGATAALVRLGAGDVVWLALPALPVLAWQLWLVSRREERRRPGVELLGASALALVAPAAVRVGGDAWEARGWLLWLLVWLQSAASILQAHMRLEPARPPGMPRSPASRGALALVAGNVVLVAALAATDVVPALLVVPYALQAVDALWSATHAAARVKPARIGRHQLGVSATFTLLFALAWRG